MIAHILLAAGAGTRVGMPKGLVVLGGVPLIERLTLESSRAGNFAIIVVTGAQSAEVAAAAARTQLTNLTIRENSSWQLGQTSSIRTGLSELAPSIRAFMIHPMDHALVRAEHLRLLADAWESAPTPHRILRPEFHGSWGHPVLFGVDYAKDFLALRDEEPGYSVYRRHRDAVTGVAMPDGDCSFDLDTQADLAEAARRLAL